MTKSRLLFLLVAAFAVVAVFSLKEPHYDACVMSWRIGNIDPRFNIADGDVRRAAESAASAWNAAAGRKLLSYDAHGGMPIDLVYDDRQIALGADRAQRDHIQLLASQIESLKAAYMVTPTQEAADRINAAVQRYNAAAAAYNAQGASEVEQGSFKKTTEKRGNRVVKESGQSISIFQFHDANDLALVITHEFGHAFGLEHVDDPAAVMSGVHGSNDAANGLQLRDADILALKRACRASAGS